MVLTLYMMQSPPSWAVMMCAKNLGLTLELKPVDLAASEHLTPEYLSMNPCHTVPVLDDDGFILIESRAIIRYLADKYSIQDEPNQFYPEDIQKRALVNQKLDFDIGTLFPAFKEAYLPIFFQKKRPTQTALDKLDNVLGFLEVFLTINRNVASQEFTVADVAIIASLSSIDACGHSFDNFPRVRDYFQRLTNEIQDYNKICGEEVTKFGYLVQETLKTIQ